MIYRSPKPEDIDFIYNSWLKSYRKSEGKMTSTIYFNKFNNIIQKIFEKALVVIVCDDEDPDLIYGYAVYENVDPVVLHYIYVKLTYRQTGIGTDLIEKIRKNDDPIICTFANYAFSKLKTKWRLTYNPWLR